MNHKVCRNPTIIPASAKLNKLKCEVEGQSRIGMQEHCQESNFYICLEGFRNGSNKALITVSINQNCWYVYDAQMLKIFLMSIYFNYYLQ